MEVKEVKTKTMSVLMTAITTINFYIIIMHSVIVYSNHRPKKTLRSLTKCAYLENMGPLL